MKNPLAAQLRPYHLSVIYPWYLGWKYDQPTLDDPFICRVIADLERAPATLRIVQAVGAEIFLCGNLGQTHMKDKVWWGTASSSPAICDPQRREIIMGRESLNENGIAISNDAPGFVIAHELAHVVDTMLGKCIDRYGEDPPVAATTLDPYAQAALNRDETAHDLTSNFEARAGLLGQNELRSSATEIICDLLAHEWSGHEPQTYRALASRYPALQDVATVMKLAAASPAATQLYRSLADRYTPLPQLRQVLIVQSQPEGGTMVPGRP